MKQTFSILLISLAFIGTGCLKDKVNTNLGDGNSTKAVSFPRSAGGMLYAISSSTTPTVITQPNTPVVAIEDTRPASTDVTVNVAVDNSIVTGAGLTPLPASVYQIADKAIIKAGTWNDTLEFTLNNTTVLDPNVVYGLGLRLTSADNGYAIPANLSTLLIRFTVKNKYDGVYTVTGLSPYIDNALGAAATGAWPLTYHLITATANTVNVYCEEMGDIAYLFKNAGGLTYYGELGFTVTFDLATDNITSVHNYYGDPGNPATGIANPASGTGPPNYASGSLGRRLRLDPTGVNKYDAASRSIEIKWQMLQNSYQGGAAPRAIGHEKWTYTGPRP